MYQRKVDVDMLNTVKSVLADVSSVSPSSEQRVDYGLGESLYSEGTLTSEETCFQVKDHGVDHQVKRNLKFD